MSFEQMMAELRAEYVASMPDKISTIDKYLQAQDLENLRNEFHKLKGTGKTYGIPEISELGLVFEKLVLNLTKLNTQKNNESLVEIKTALRLLNEIYTKRKAGEPYPLQKDTDFIKVQNSVI